MLSHPSSLIRAVPTPLVRWTSVLRTLRSLLRLAGFIRLGLAYLSRRTKETRHRRLQTSLFHFPSIACRWPYSGSRTVVYTLFLHRALRPSLCMVEGRRVSGSLHPVYPTNRTLPAIIVLRYFTKLHHSLYATTCDLGRRPRLGMTLRSSRCQRRFLHIEHESKAPSWRRVGASSARALLREPAPSLHIEKGN
jgi:hypothetical protein